MYTCASCTLRSCQKGGGDLPRNCPMRDPEFFDRLGQALQISILRLITRPFVCLCHHKGKVS